MSRNRTQFIGSFSTPTGLRLSREYGQQTLWRGTGGNNGWGTTKALESRVRWCKPHGIRICIREQHNRQTHPTHKDGGSSQVLVASVPA